MLSFYIGYLSILHLHLISSHKISNFRPQSSYLIHDLRSDHTALIHFDSFNSEINESSYRHLNESQDSVQTIFKVLYMQFSGLKNSRAVLFFGAVALSLGLSQAAIAQEENIEVTPSQQVTQQELAAIYVLSEVCPSLVKENNQFQQGYAKLAQEYMPKEKDAVAALDKISKQKNFQPMLKEARADAKAAGTAKNQAICQELTAYNR